MASASASRFWPRLTSLVTDRRRSAMYDGASPSLYVSRHSLNWTRCWTGSQWRRSRNTCLMWSCFLAPTINRAAVRVHHRLQPVELIAWNSGQQTVVNPGDDDTPLSLLYLFKIYFYPNVGVFPVTTGQFDLYTRTNNFY